MTFNINSNSENAFRFRLHRIYSVETLLPKDARSKMCRALNCCFRAIHDFFAANHSYPNKLRGKIEAALLDLEGLKSSHLIDAFYEEKKKSLPERWRPILDEWYENIIEDREVLVDF